MNTILVVGASGGIGRIVARNLLARGCAVIGTNFKNDFQPYLVDHANFTGKRLDLNSAAQIEALRAELTRVAAVVNCAGVVEFEAYNDPEENLNIWQRTMSVNATGSYLLFEKLRGSILPGGSYIMISSTDSYYGGKVNTAYAASKSAVNSLTKSLALMYPDSKVRVNAIAPGWVETAMMEASGDELIEYARSINPQKRNGQPQDVAHLVEFLISEKASYINGQIVTIDGGYTLQDPTLVFEEQSLLKQRQT